ncbi:hypothetical protein NUKP16_18090 [Klebsiella quasipneumoniae]|jgi:hypothetical protein|nr:hypothetical protein NUKP16_18090 [Klebsiella quasipneumoniae]
MFSVHGAEYAAAVSPGATTENGFPGQTRKKGLHDQQQNIFLRASFQLSRPPTPAASGRDEAFLS